MDEEIISLANQIVQKMRDKGFIIKKSFGHLDIWIHGNELFVGNINQKIEVKGKLSRKKRALK